jgi:hypothetical protein
MASVSVQMASILAFILSLSASAFLWLASRSSNISYVYIFVGNVAVSEANYLLFNHSSSWMALQPLWALASLQFPDLIDSQSAGLLE